MMYRVVKAAFHPVEDWNVAGVLHRHPEHYGVCFGPNHACSVCGRVPGEVHAFLIEQILLNNDCTYTDWWGDDKVNPQCVSHHNLNVRFNTLGTV